MKLRSSKAAFLTGVTLAACLMPVMPVVADAGTTYEQQQSTQQNTIMVSYAGPAQEVVAVSSETNKETAEYENKAIAIAQPYVEVKLSEDDNAQTAGRLYTNNIADVIEVKNDWTKISSGNLSGYVKTASLCFNEEAKVIADEVGSTLDTGLTNEEVKTKEEAEEQARKAAEEKAAQEAAKKAAEEKAALEAKKKAELNKANAATSASADDVTLLATIIDWEAGCESYEGKLAVANVVLNRVRSSRYPNTISGVIYQSGQFSGVSDGSGNPSSRFAKRLAGKRSSESIKAAKDALAGKNNVGSYKSFRATRIANYSAYSSYTVIGNHCFY